MLVALVAALVLAHALAAPAPAMARAANGIVVATWNLAWLMSPATHARWVRTCARHGWPRAPEPGSPAALELRGLPYCNVHNGMVFPPERCPAHQQALETRSRFEPEHPCRVSLDLAEPAAYARKLQALRRVFDDIEAAGVTHLALQEVFDADAVRAILPASWDVITTRELDGGDALSIPQHVGIAFRRDGVRPTRLAAHLALADSGDPARPLRPGLTFELPVAGVPVRFLVVHLKAGCRSRVIDDPLRRYDRTDEDKARVYRDCGIFRRQVPVLEDWIDARTREGRDYIVIGDFNRALGREHPFRHARLDDSDPASPNGNCRDAVTADGFSTTRCDGRVHQLLPELNDRQPAAVSIWRADFIVDGKRLRLQHGEYARGSIGDCAVVSRAAFAREGETPRQTDLAHDGIDHILISGSLKKRLRLGRPAMARIALRTAFAGPLPPDEALPSDHCPHLLRLVPGG
ncbi:MAG: hypothetical protein R3E48_10985 [Burkholderiaceae bacterium]